MTTSPAITFRDALCARDFDALAAAVADDATMRGLLPPRIIEAQGRDDILAWFTKWFAGGSGFEVIACSAEATAGRTRVTWRFRFSSHPVSGDLGDHEIEQTAFCDHRDGLVTRIDLLCSGFRPLAAPGAV